MKFYICTVWKIGLIWLVSPTKFNRFFPLLTFLQFFFLIYVLFFFFLSSFNHKSYHHHHHHQRFTHPHTHADKMNFKIGNLKLFPLTWLHLTYSYRRIAQPHCLLFLEETHPIFSPFHISFLPSHQLSKSISCLAICWNRLHRGCPWFSSVDFRFV